MVQVEVELENAFEIHNVLVADGLPWWDANTFAIGIVFRNLERRVINEGLVVGELQMCARSTEFDSH